MSTIKTDNLQNAAGTLSVPVGTVVNGSAKAWVNFNGTGTVAIRAAFNVSSITDNGTGQYTLNFTTALSDANYAPVISVSTLNHGTGCSVRSASNFSAPVTKTTTALSVGSSTDSGTFLDATELYVAIFR